MGKVSLNLYETSQSASYLYRNIGCSAQHVFVLYTLPTGDERDKNQMMSHDEGG